MITRVRFGGIKSLLDVSIDLERFTVLVGPNGCGKSTVLNEIDLLCRLSVPAPSDSWASIPLVRLTADAETRRRRAWNGPMVWTGETTKARLTVAVKPGIRPHDERVTMQATTAAKDTLLTLQGANKAREPLELSLKESFTWRSLRLRLDPAAIAAPSHLHSGSTELTSSGAGLPTLLSLIKLNDTTRLTEIEDDLRLVVPAFEHLGFIPVDLDGTRGGYQLSLSVRGGGPVPADQVSDGTLLALALLTATHNRDLPSLLLMDDLDHGLHLGAQYALIQAIRRVMAVREDLQVVASTHSPILLDAMKPEEVRVMNLDVEGCAVVRPLTAMPDFDRNRRGLQTGELWASMGEDWVIESARE